MFQTATTAGFMHERLIDPNAIDITSLKGRFAWEKIPMSDIYVPVIFRGDTKYFCVRMLRKVLPDYPEDVLARAIHYRYHKPLDLYHVTPNEIDLLDRINHQHARCSYSRQSFGALDEIVRVTDFLPFYEHLRVHFQSGSATTQAINNALRQFLPHASASLAVQRTAPTHPAPAPPPPQLIPTASLPRQPHPASIDRIQSNPPPMHKRSTLPAPSILRHAARPIRPVITTATTSLHPIPAPIGPTLMIPVISPPHPLAQPPTAPAPVARAPSHGLAISPIVNPNNTPLEALNIGQSDTPSSTSSSSSLSNTQSASSSPVFSGALTSLPRKPSSTSKMSGLYSGWIQINKLYTPYVTSSISDHHQYKIPVSLLSFYDLINLDDPTAAFEQSSVSAEELDLINDLCLKHGIRPFATDTKMIDLATFYRYCSANMIFIKELPMTEPKLSICKDWLTVVQFNGGICRLRNISSLHEHTVPFIGNNLLKSFIVSSHCLSTATLTKPNALESEFLLMILFFSNLRINLGHAQFIDLDSVKKEYTVDLILLFNDKFPLNVLNYQQQGTRANPSGGAAAKNTIAESTPPPSPPSPPATSNPTPTAQLPLTSPTNRYHKTIEFHGHSLTAYICSGLGTNAQRECVSIKSLCQIMRPDVSAKDEAMERLEMQMLRLLRAKSVNRYRPQNQQSMGFTRLIDIRDAERYWTYLESEMLSTSAPEPPASTARQMRSAGKRLFEEDNQPLEEDDVPVAERLNKRLRTNEEENHEEIPEISLSVLSHEPVMETNEPIPTAVPVEAPAPVVSTEPKRIRTPASRSKKTQLASWAKKYQLEDFSVRVDLYRIPVESASN